jgi:hypothetical protein
MKLTLNRHTFTDTYTIGKLYIGDDYFCDTLEDPNRDLNKNGIFDSNENKVYGNTCIPFGIYEIEVTYSPKFKRELPRLLNVPSFEGVLIHRGNSPIDTLGCILLGENKIKGKVINSTPYEIKLVNLMKEAKVKKEKILLQIM